MSLLTGNGDLHLENLSIIERNGERRFTSIYDPAPMRAYSQHDMLSVMPFGDYGEMPEGFDQPVSFNEAIGRFAGACGLKFAQSDAVIHELLGATRDYAARVEQLATLPDENKARLLQRVGEVRGWLGS